MSILLCDLCGKDHAVQDCKIFTEHGKFADTGGLQLQIPLSYQTLPSWVYIDENQRKLIACKEIEVSFRVGPFLAPQSTTLKQTIDFPLYFENNLKLWLDQSDGSKCNWLSLIPPSPYNYNMVACQILDSIYYVVVKPIKIGQDLKVWYAPFYKPKIPPEILERIISSFRNDGAIEENEELEEASLTDLSVKIEGKEEPVSLFGNSSTYLHDTQLLDSHYIPNSNVSFTTEGSTSQASGLGTSHNAKVLLSCSVSLPSSFTTLSSSSASSASTFLPLNSTTQPLFLVPVTLSGTGGSFNTTNPELPIYNSLPYLPLNIKHTGIIPISNQSHLGEQEDILQVQTKQDSSSHNDALESQEKNSSSSKSGQANQNLKYFNLNSLQSITISKGKIMFTYGFSKSNLEKSNSPPRDQSLLRVSRRKSNVNNIKGNTKNKTIVVNSKEERSQSKSYHCIKSLQNVDISLVESKDEVDFELGYDMISLNITNDESRPLLEPPVCKILKKQKSLKNQCQQLSSKKQYCDSSSIHLSALDGHWTCALCPDTFTEKVSFALHLKNHLMVILGRKFVCESCNCHFKNQDHLKIHMISHLNGTNTCTEKEKLSVNELSSETKHRSSIIASNQSSKESKPLHRNFECQICQKRFSNGKYLLRHLSKHCGEFVCSLCKKEFARNENLRKHLCVQKFSKSPFKCDLCKKSFKNRNFYKRHLMQHEDKIKCWRCSRIFLNRASLHKHEKNCSIRNPQGNTVEKGRAENENSRFCCHICNRNFSSLFFLNNHVTLCKQLADVSEKGTVNCDVCNSLCAGPSELRTHLQTHTHPYLCLSCSQRFRSRGTYEMHICNVHFFCDFCDSALRSLHELYKHVTMHGPPSLCCSRCRYPYYKKESLNEHRCQVEVKEQVENTGRKRVNCPFCPALFVAEHNLKKHMASLHGIPVKQKFVCGKCGKKFHRSDLLKAHERIHLAPSLECQECHKKFKSQRSFANHSVLHKKDFRFTCKHCNKGFTQKKDVFRHEKTHISSGTPSSAASPFKCQQCNICFPTNQLLESHLLTHDIRPSASRRTGKRPLNQTLT